MKEITSILRSKVNEWNNVCATMNSSLFLADSFQPKTAPLGSTSEVIFWYDIINLYALFADCMPYFLKAGELFNRTQISLQNSNSLLDLLKNNFFINYRDAGLIEKYISAIKEARGCFCHNKCMSTYNYAKLNQGIGKHTSDWKFYMHLGAVNTFDFDEGIELLFIKTNNIIRIIDQALNSAQIVTPIQFLDDWSKSISAWYMSSNDIIFRGLIAYKNANKINKVYDGFSKMDKSVLQALAKSKRITVETLVQNLHEELTDEVRYSSATATPENVLYRLFDSII